MTTTTIAGLLPAVCETSQDGAQSGQDGGQALINVDGSDQLQDAQSDGKSWRGLPGFGGVPERRPETKTAISMGILTEPGDQIALPGIDAVPFDLERGREFFPTPFDIARYAVDRLVPELAGGRPDVIDAGAGGAIWARATKTRWPGATVTGIDLPGVPAVNGWCDHWIGADFLEWAPFTPARFDLLVSNPPFTKAEEFIRLGHRLLRPGGYLVFFLRQAFRAGITRGASLWHDLPPQLISTSSRRPSFTGDGVSDQKTEYSVFVWQAGYTGPTLDPGVFDYKDESTWPKRDQVQGWIDRVRDPLPAGGQLRQAPAAAAVNRLRIGRLAGLVY